ncbi:MAG: hypothetical protein WC312_03520 [Candidatus Omnitrophota bacterium]|jgi:hypothetical protein
MGFKNKFFYYSLLVLYVFFIVILVDFLFYIKYYNKIIPPKDILNRSIPHQYVLINQPQDDKESSPVHFSKNKHKGVIRIGCFGDSSTHGDEVSFRYDYPSLLQRLLEERGFSNVEVINFGQSAIGFHQSFNKWRYFGKEYDLDYVILGPSCFQFERDCTFSNGWDNATKDSFHIIKARYIIEHDELRLIEPVGVSYGDMVKNYVRFVPYWRYLRYDMRAPAFIEAPVDFIVPKRRFKKNPFYYHPSMNDEMKEIYKRLMSEMVKQTSQVILFNGDPEIVRLGREVKPEGLYAFYVTSKNNFLYHAYKGHCSPNGNELMAEYIFACLTGTDVMRVPSVDFENPDSFFQDLNTVPFHSLAQYSKISIEMNGTEIGKFYDMTHETWFPYCTGPDCLSTVDTFANVKSLIGFKSGQGTFADTIFSAVDFNLSNNAAAILQSKWRGETTTIQLAPLQFIHRGINIGTVDFGNFYFDKGINCIILDKESLATQLSGLPNGADVVISVDNQPILCGKNYTNDPKIHFNCTNISRYFTINADGNVLLDVSRLPQEGNVYLRLDMDDPAATVRLPVAHWRKVEYEFQFENHIKNLLVHQKK